MKRPVSDRELRKLKRFIEMKLGINPRIRTAPLKDYHGICYPDEQLVIINVNLRKGMYIHTLFHEAMHAYCFENGLFKAYHEIDENDATPEQLANWFRTAVRAEMYVDARATELLKEYDPRLTASVKTKEDWQDIFKKYRRELKEKKHGITR